MTPQEQAHKLVHDYYTIITGSAPGENVNQEALREAIERAKVTCLDNWWKAYVLNDKNALDEVNQVINKLNEM